MSTSIDTITVGGIEDRRLVLSNAQAARLINIGSSWTTIRIGVRLCMFDTGASIGGTPRLYMGMIASPLADMSNGPLGNATSHFVGLITNSANFSRASGPPVFYTDNVDSNYGKKVGATITSTVGTNQNLVVATNNTPRRSLIIMELTKGSPNFTMSFCLPQTGTTPLDVTSVNTFKTAMSASTMANAANVLVAAGFGNYSSAYTANVPVDEGTNGALNAVCIAWDQVSLMYFSDLAWAKIA